MNSQLDQSASVQALPSHSSFWSTVLHQEITPSYQAEQVEATSEGSQEAIWQPVRYQLKLGLRGWIVSETVVAPATTMSDVVVSSISTDNDQHRANQHPNQDNVSGSDADADSTISDSSMASDHGSDSTSFSHNDGLLTLFRWLRNSSQIDESQQGLLKGLGIMYSRLHPSRFRKFPIRTSPTVLTTTFSRQVLSRVYGGSPINTFPVIEKDRSTSKYARLMCINLLYNPYGPQHPGAPGLFFALREPSRWPQGLELVFSRYGANQWNLMGKYVIKRCAPLSREEFSSLDEKVQQTWLESVWSHKWGDLTLTAIYLRHTRGREPTDEEVDHFVKTEISLVRRKVLMEDVKQAFLNGEENINVWTMKCIGYDEPFKRRLVPEALRAHGQATANRNLITRYNLRSVKAKRSGGSKKGTVPKKTYTNAKRCRF